MISEYAGSCYVFIKTNTVSLHATIIDTIEKEYLPQTVYTPVTNGYVISRSGCWLLFVHRGAQIFHWKLLKNHWPGFTGIQDFWGLEVCNGFGGFWGR